LTSSVFEELSSHCRNVSKITMFLVEKMNFPDAYCKRLRPAAMFHDVGKLGIPHTILSRPGPLDPLSRKIVQRHTLAGWQMAKNWPARNGTKEMILDVILNHHERFDGNGYPNGVRGRRIPFSARIVAIADVVQALSVKRCYRPAWEWERIVAYVEQERGQQFDPDLADHFLVHADAIKRMLRLLGSDGSEGDRLLRQPRGSRPTALCMTRSCTG